MVLGWFKKLKSGLSKSSEKISGGIKRILKSKKIDESTLEELEELLIASDLGVDFSSKIISDLRKSKLVNPSPEKVKGIIEKKLVEILISLEKTIILNSNPYVILIVGVNGVGKTATIGKLADRFLNEGKKVGMVAADTFRAAAVEQLKIWSDRTNSEFFSAKESSDPAALAYQSIITAKEKKLDLLLVDTAGRLHNKTDLMNELSKIIRVMKKIDDSIPSEIILVLDGNIGQNSIKQAEVFKEICDVDSLIITKLDGTAKGGALIPIAEKLKIPISFIGTGESKEDLAKFEAKKFSKALLGID
jgi:fused signal recognition particle receptor